MNTRCIYYPIDPSRSSPNNLTLCPILDFANHTPSSTLIVPVFPPLSTVSAPGSKARRGDYTFLSPSEPQILKNDEILLKYGSHPNRTLFVEYGFINLWEDGECTAGGFPAEVDLQDLIEALFEQRGATGAWMKEVLQQEGYWGYSYLPLCTYMQHRTNLSLCAPESTAVIGRYIRPRRRRILRTASPPLFDYINCLQSAPMVRRLMQKQASPDGETCSPGEPSMSQTRMRRGGGSS